MDKDDLNKIPCTVAILTHNSAATLSRALESADSFAEIIICDGSSRDSTLKIAASHGAVILRQDPKFLEQGHIMDFAGVRNQTLKAATFPWFFFLDSDECLSVPLVEEIREFIAREAPAACYVHRRYELSNQIIDCASTYPNRNMRFFHKDAVTEFIKPVHERIEVRESAPIRDLRSEAYIIVPVYDTPAISRRKNREYIKIEVARIDSLSLFSWLSRTFKRSLISGKYILRTLRCYIFCNGNIFPISYEVNRHWYHLLLSYRELSRLGWKTKMRG